MHSSQPSPRRRNHQQQQQQQQQEQETNKDANNVMRELTPSPRSRGIAHGNWTGRANKIVNCLKDVPREIELLICCAGVFVSFSYFAVCAEDVYKKQERGDERFSMTFYALVIERFINAFSAFVIIFVFGGSGFKLPLREIFNSGATQMFAMAASNEALRYVSYPTQVLGKSCKMVPVMVGGLLVGGRKFTRFQYVSVAFVTFGVFLFNMGGGSSSSGGHQKSTDDKGNSMYGLFLIFVSLVFDAITGGLQDKVKITTKSLNPSHSKTAKPSAHESMLYTNLSGAICALFFAIFTGQISSGFYFCQKHPKVLKSIVSYSLASAIGQNFIYHTITSFDVLVLTTVTTTRKIFSTLFSVFRNPNLHLTTVQWLGCFVVFIFLALETVEKIHKNRKAPSTSTTIGGRGRKKGV
jgi:solute carrier family 35 (UDP-galactose transporter), member B1